MNHDGYLPEFVTVTEGKTSDIEIGRTLKFPKGSMVAIDRGYTDYAWYNQLTEKGIFFVTRLKSNAQYRVVSRRPVLKDKGLTCDQTIEFIGRQTAKKCPIQLHRIGYRDPETGKHYVFLTNNFKLAAKTIADIYKAHWQVELFFDDLSLCTPSYVIEFQGPTDLNWLFADFLMYRMLPSNCQRHLYAKPKAHSGKLA